MANRSNKTKRDPLQGGIFDRAPVRIPGVPAAWAVGGLVAFFALWEAGAWYMSAVLPRSDRVFPSWLHIFGESLPAFGVFSVAHGESYRGALSTLVSHSLDTGLRVAIGTTSGILLGAIVGLAMAFSPISRRALGPVINILRTVPLLALIPLFIIWFGGREIGVRTYVVFAVFVMIVIATFHAALNVPDLHTRYARTLGATRAGTFRDVIVPGMLPELLGAIRLVFALSWSFALGAEYTGAQSGLGFLLIASQRFGFIGRVIIITLTFTIFALTIDSLIRWIASLILRWQP